MSLGSVHVVLVRPRQPGNVGAAARAIANHGLGGLTLVSPAGFDPERARWMAPGAADVIDGARIVGTVAEAVSEAAWVVGTSARPRRWDWPLLDPAGLAAGVRDADGRVVLLFGPEDVGLANEDLARCHALLCLPTVERASLNLGAAVAVTAAGLLDRLHAEGSAAAPGRPRATPVVEPAATVAEQAGLIDAATATLDASGYLSGRAPEQVHGTLYRLLGRAAPSLREVHILRGMLASLRAR